MWWGRIQQLLQFDGMTFSCFFAEAITVLPKISAKNTAKRQITFLYYQENSFNFRKLLKSSQGPHFENHCSLPRAVVKLDHSTFQPNYMLPYVVSYLMSRNLISVIRNCIIYVVVSWGVLKCLALSLLKFVDDWLTDTLEIAVHVQAYVITYHILVGFAFYLGY